jgi:hypothetical protein
VAGVFSLNNKQMKTQIDIPVSVVKPVLPGLAKIIGRSRTLPVLNCVKVSVAAGAQLLTLQANNLDEVASVRLPLEQPQSAGELLVPLGVLTDLLKRCSGEQVIQVIVENNETRVRYSAAGSAVERVIEHVPLKEWPEPKAIEVEPFELEDGFKLALKEALECASDEPGRYLLQGACLDLQKDGHYVVGSDGRHLYAGNSFRFQLPESVIVRTNKFVCWPPFMNDGVWKLRMGKPANGSKRGKDKDEPAWVQIDSEHWSYAAKAVAGNYPNWKQVVPPEASAATRVEFGPAAVDAMLDAIPQLPGSELPDQAVSIEAGQKGVVLHARGQEGKDQAQTPISGAQVAGRPVQISLNRKYLLKALRFGFTSLQIQDELSAMRFSQTGKVMVIMPLRPSPPSAAAPVEAPAAATKETPPDAQPSASGAPVQTEERNDKPVTETTTTTNNKRSNGHAQNVNRNADEPRSAFKAAVDQIDQIKTKLKDVMVDLAEAVAMLKTAEKEQRLNLKEVETVRAKLREIQSVSI